LALLHLSLPNNAVLYPDERLLGWTTRPARREHWQTADLSSRWYTPQGPTAVVVHGHDFHPPYVGRWSRTWPPLSTTLKDTAPVPETTTHLSTLPPALLEHDRHLEALSWSSVRLLPRSLTTWRDVLPVTYHHRHVTTMRCHSMLSDRDDSPTANPQSYLTQTATAWRLLLTVVDAEY
jgi:hypothetical protein